MTTEEIADYFQVHKNTVRAWIKRGVPHIKIDRIIRYDLDKVLAWLKEQEEVNE